MRHLPVPRTVEQQDGLRSQAGRLAAGLRQSLPRVLRELPRCRVDLWGPLWARSRVAAACREFGAPGRPHCYRSRAHRSRFPSRRGRGRHGHSASTRMAPPGPGHDRAGTPQRRGRQTRRANGDASHDHDRGEPTHGAIPNRPVGGGPGEERSRIRRSAGPRDARRCEACFARAAGSAGSGGGGAHRARGDDRQPAGAPAPRRDRAHRVRSR